MLIILLIFLFIILILLISVLYPLSHCCKINYWFSASWTRDISPKETAKCTYISLQAPFLPAFHQHYPLSLFNCYCFHYLIATAGHLLPWITLYDKSAVLENSFFCSKNHRFSRTVEMKNCCFIMKVKAEFITFLAS